MFMGQSCSLRDRSIGACNHCEHIKRCRLDHFFYNASKSHEEYLFHLSVSRQGVNLSEPHRILIAQTIKPLLDKGQSLYHILENHPELDISVKSLYTYIEGGIFKDFGIDNFSLRRQVSMRQRQISSIVIPRLPLRNLTLRTIIIWSGISCLMAESFLL